MSRYHFLRVFREVSGVSPGRFLAALRIEKAKRLLLTSDESITDVCFHIGYSSLGTFSRFFSELVGICPNAFRQLGVKLGHHSIERLITEFLERKNASGSPARIPGSVHCPSGFDGIVFLGVFDVAIPQRRPIAGTVLFSPGHFDLPCPEVDGQVSLMAAGLPMCSQIIDYLLPSSTDVLVGSREILIDEKTRIAKPVSIYLRRPASVDPPIVVAFPVLLQNAATAGIF